LFATWGWLFYRRRITPTLYPGVAQQLACVDVGVVQQDATIAVGMLEDLQAIVTDIGVGMAAVDERKVDSWQTLPLIVGEEVSAGVLEMGD
jgi:hypothetical protein